MNYFQMSICLTVPKEVIFKMKVQIDREITLTHEEMKEAIVYWLKTMRDCPINGSVKLFLHTDHCVLVNNDEYQIPTKIS